MKRTFDDLIPAKKHFHGIPTCLLDLPDEILLKICRYLSIYDIFHCFYVPEQPKYRLHRLVYDYILNLNLSGIECYHFKYLIELFNEYLRPISLKLDNSNISYLTKIESFHLIIYDDSNHHEKESYYYEESFDRFLHKILFSQHNQLLTLHTINIQSLHGLSLYKSLISNENLHYINISLHTIDDLFLLINGLIPNTQILNVQLKYYRLLKKFYHPTDK